MTTLLSYHGDPAVKQKYVERFAQHRAADEVIQGTGFSNGRGCFVGCTLNSYDHKQFPVELGWPEWLAYLADRIFEGLPKEEAPQFGTDLLDAVPVGVDLEPVKHMTTILRMDRLIALQKNNTGYDTAEVISALELSKRCAEAELDGNQCDWSAAAESAEWSEESAEWSAESAEWSAEWSAASAAWSAASAARAAAESAEWSARAAARSAEAAAWSAEAAAEAEAAYQQERDALLSVLRSMAPKEVL